MRDLKRPKIDEVTPEWVKEHLALHNLTARELGHQIGQKDDAYLSGWFGGSRQIGGTTKAAIWQFFERLK